MLRIGVLMGGPSREREISFAGGRTVMDNLDRALFDFAGVAAGATPVDASAADIGFDVDPELEHAIEAGAAGGIRSISIAAK